jgi:predicted Zn finger-like uncharacterized protein
MYTQCPECGVAFRVTAEVLKQAAGKVRCGGCGIAFNALEHLSELKPAAPVKPEVVSEPNLPELTPEEPGELEADTPPQTISAEQSAALLKTLDELAGSDIRIEDTGVEWRVLDEDAIDDEIVVEETDLIADTGSLKFIVEGEEDIVDDEPEAEPAEVIEEMRFDDNTPLPDDFDLSEEPQTPEEPVEAPEPDPEPVKEEPQVDLALGDPDEWQDLLGDLDEAPVEEDAAEEVDEDAETIVEDVAADVEDDLVSLAETASEEATTDEPLDMDTQFAIQAEAMGIDLSGIHETIDEESQQAGAEAEGQSEPQVEEEVEAADKTDTSIEEDLIAAAFEAETALKAHGDGEEDDPADEQREESIEEDEDSAEELDSVEEEVAQDEEEEIEIDIDTAIEPVDEDEIDDDVEVIASGFDDEVEEVIGTLSASLDEMDSDEPEQASDDDDASAEHFIPEMTEEEKTINMMIDQELFNIAVEDEDGFASTIVQARPNKDGEEEPEENKKQEPADKAEEEKEESPLVETIIMEGDFVRGELDKNRIAAEKSVAAAAFEDPGLSIPLKKTMRGMLRRSDDRYHANPPGAGMIVGAIALLLLLAAQVMHQSREALATVPLFNQTVGPLYRMLGRPLTPTWDISGWRFEATKGSTESTNALDDAAESNEMIPADEVLTIYSRVGNKSDKALPYPLVHLSLTDRFEEIIGSRVLEPSEYLAENADPRKPVPPGNTFNAVFAIDSPSAEATGFKLNVCYRLAGGQLRCAIEDFK